MHEQANGETQRNGRQDHIIKGRSTRQSSPEQVPLLGLRGKQRLDVQLFQSTNRDGNTYDPHHVCWSTHRDIDRTNRSKPHFTISSCGVVFYSCTIQYTYVLNKINNNIWIDYNFVDSSINGSKEGDSIRNVTTWLPSDSKSSGDVLTSHQRGSKDVQWQAQGASG